VTPPGFDAAAGVISSWSSGIVQGWMSATGSPPPTDPFGPVSQNPDDVRDAACRLVATSSVCNPAAPPNSVANHAPNVAAGGGSLLGAMLWGLLIVVIVAIVFVAIRFFAERRPGTRDSSDDDADPDDDALAGTVVIDRSREPRGWREEAERHRAAGRFRDAIRCRYRALVGDLARRGLIDEIPGRTTGEERRQLRVSGPNAVPFFREAADMFDAAWYGNVTVGLIDDDRFQQLDREVLANAAALPHRVPRSFAVQSGGAGA
jgi:Domain of unknown function (DUF4129)